MAQTNIEHSGEQRKGEFATRLAELAQNGYRVDVERRGDVCEIVVRRAGGELVARASGDDPLAVAREARTLTLQRGNVRDGWSHAWVQERIEMAVLQ